MDAGGGEAPLEPIDHDDHRGYVVLAIYAPFFVMLTFWAARLFLRWKRMGLMLDDLFLVCAMVLAVVQTVCLQLAVSAGLGKRSVDTWHLQRFERYYYASVLLNILCQASSKASMSVLFHQLRPFREFAIANFVNLGLTGFWAVGSLFTIAFQCHLPEPWRYSSARCVDLRGMYLGIDISNIISELCLIAIPAAFMPRVQNTWSIRLLIIGCFATRVGVIITLIGHAVDVSTIHLHTNPSWTLTIPTIWLQIAMNTSVLTACIPGIQNFLADLRSGLIIPEVTTNRHQHEAVKSASIFASSRSKGENSKSSGSGWEMSKMTGSRKSSRKERDTETESERRLTPSNIVVTKEVSQTVES